MEELKTSGGQPAVGQSGGQGQPGSVNTPVGNGAEAARPTETPAGNSGAVLETGKQETPGVNYYDASVYESIDPTAIDFKRVRPEDYHLLHRRQASVHGRVTQETREFIRSQAGEINELKAMVSKLNDQNAKALQQVADLLKGQSDRENSAQEAARQAKRKEIYDNLPPEAQFLFDELYAFKEELDSVKKGVKPPEGYEDVMNFVQSERKAKEFQSVASRADTVINGVIGRASIPEAIKKDKAFGRRVRTYIRDAWELQEERGIPTTPLEEMTEVAIRFALEDIRELGGLSGHVAGAPNGGNGGTVEVPATNGQPGGQQLTPEQIAAQGAPPRSTGSSGPAANSNGSIEAQRQNGFRVLFNQLRGATK